MDNETKKKINERYEQELQKGERFWPDSIFKDVIMALAIFVVLALLATFVGIPTDPKADPSDTSYVPRPEWYFLFLFKFLALYGQIPLLGKIEWLATVVIPVIAIGVLFLLPFIERSPYRYYGKRVLPICIMVLVVVGMVMLSLVSDIPTGLTLEGILQAIAGLVIPLVALIALFLMSFIFKRTSTKAMIWTTAVSSALMIALTAAVLVVAPAPVQEEVLVATTAADQFFAGQDLYSIHCVECHGDDGAVTTITGVEGLEGKVISPINGRDILYTLNDASMAEVIAYGRPEAGMNPFGKAYNSEGLSKSDIDYLVAFMRFSWDDRFELPPEALKPLFPPLAEGEIPSYEVHIAPIVKRYCISCHRAGKDNNNYLMDTYDNMINSGDEAPNMEAGDLESILLKTIHGTPIPDPDDPTKALITQMPPNKLLKDNIVDVFVRWVMAGMPNTAADAALIPTPTPQPTATPEGFTGTPVPETTPVVTSTP
jgi:mono/diheme cytochrome c family protein